MIEKIKLENDVPKIHDRVYQTNLKREKYANDALAARVLELEGLLLKKMTKMANPHRILHENITLLLNFHPAHTDELKKAIKENMFVLPNKKGFFEITNYINSIIDKEKWNSIISWPVINNKDEMKFRRAVIKFVADLNSLYDVQVVPTLNPSRVISPGGLQVARFILKLSEYAIRKFMEESLGFENTLQCLKYNIPNSVKLKLDTVSLHKKVQCLKKLETTRKNINYAIEQRKHMQQQLLNLRASNSDIEREIIKVEPMNNSKEYLEQWTSGLNKRIEKRHSYIDYLAGIDNSVRRCHQAANTGFENDANSLILDGFKIIKSPTENNETSPTDLTSHFKTSAEIARRLALRLKSSESTQGDSQVASSVQRIETEVSLEGTRLELLEQDILSHIEESQRAINELEPKAFSSIIDDEKIPPEIKNYAASPALSLAKTDASARRLQIACPVRENSILDWVKNKLFNETEKVPSNRNTPLKRDHVSLIPKKGLIAKKTTGLAMQSEQSPIRLQRKLQTAPETPKMSSFGPVRRLIQEAKAESPKSKCEDEDSIVLPHDLSVSTASPCSSPTCLSPNTPKDLRWQQAAPSTVSSTAVSSITSPNTWAEENGNDIFSSTPFMINNNSVCSSTTEHQSQDLCHSSPAGAVHLPVGTTGNRKGKMRPSLENIIARYKAYKRNQQE